MNHVDDVIVSRLRRGPATSKELQTLAGMSQAGCSQHLRRLGRAGALVAFGRARATRYGIPREVVGLRQFPVIRISPEGTHALVGTIMPLLPEGAVFIDGDQTATWYEGVPWFLVDMAPQGFLGRGFANRFPELRLPPRITDWRDDDVLAALALRGDDAPGDLIVGADSFGRYLERCPTAYDAAAETFESLARQAVDGIVPGSSAGGEQPKFAVRLVAAANDPQNDPQDVLVKFSPIGDTPQAQRVRDLLVCECLALDALRRTRFDLQVPRCRVVVGPQRVFLEIQRFDRTPLGRVGCVSLHALDMQFIGSNRQSWTDSAMRMKEQGLIDDADATRIVFLESFGHLIGNTDMHFGNLSFFLEAPRQTRSFALAPVYDQLPMRYMPTAAGIADGELTGSGLRPRPEALPVYDDAVDAAGGFWTAVAGDERISTDFRAIATRNLDAVGCLSTEQSAT